MGSRVQSNDALMSSARYLSLDFLRADLSLEDPISQNPVLL